MLKEKILILIFIFTTLSIFSQEQKLVLNENFDDNINNWDIEDKDNRKAKIEKGTYILSTKNTNTKTFLANTNSIDLDDLNFTIETKIMHVSGVENFNYSLRFGENSNYAISFSITANGYFRVNEYYNKKWDQKIKYTTTDALKKSGKYNVLKVTRKAQVLQFYINGMLVYSCFEKIYFGHQIGFSLPTGKDMKIKVDYLKIWTSPLEIPTVENPLENVEFENLGPGVNSAITEKAPMISADGKTLYFIRDEKLKGIEDTKDQVYSSQLNENGIWKEAIKSPFPINPKANTGVIAVSSDQNKLTLYSTRTKKGEHLNSSGLCVSTRLKNNKWSVPHNLEIKDYINKSDYREFCISSTGNVLILAIESEFSYGEKDLYVSFFKNGSWSKPKNLGATINSIGREMTPFIAADDKTLYFSSKGLPGYGSSDVFVTKRLDDSWLNWSKPLNLGKGINGTGGDDFFTVMASGEYGFISKWVNDGYGRSDLYRIKLSTSAKPEPLVLVQGKVLNKKTNEPISAEIKYFKLGNDTIIGTALSAPTTGSYQVSLPAGKKYAYYAEKEGFYAIEDNLDLESLKEFKTLEKNLYLVPIEKGETIRLNNIFFETAKATLLPESYTELDKLLNVLKNNPKLTIKINGHTDNVGSEAANQLLSKDRAKAVYNYLISNNIKSNRLSFEGFGESKPIESNETENGKKINRRVEFEVL